MTGFTTCAVFIFKTEWSCTLSLDGIKPTHLKRQLTLALDLMVTMSVAVNTSPIQESNHIPHALIDLSTLFFFNFLHGQVRENPSIPLESDLLKTNEDISS